jgi:radical SAM protein with 4Fe4S-binding SPASM domain
MTYLESKNRRNLWGDLLYYRTIIITKLFDLWNRVMGKIKPGSFFYPLAVDISKRLIGGAPLAVKVDLTNRCNLWCKMCYRVHDGQDMPADVIWEMLGQIGSAPVWLELLGGEPILCDEIYKIIEWAKTKTSIQKVLLYTNATLITEEKARRLKEAGLDKAIVTLVSHDPAKHDIFTGVVGSWKMTIEGVRNLSRAGIKTNTFTPLHSENIDDLREINDFVNTELGITPNFFQYVPQEGAKDTLRVTADRWKEAKHDILCKFSKKHVDVFKRMVSMCGTLCVGGRNLFHIKTDGNVTPCPFVGDVVLGNIFEDNFWNILSRRKKGKSFLDFVSVPEECGVCSYKNVCGGGCKAGNKSLTGSYRARDYRCLGPWSGPISDKDMHKKLPNFF